MAINFQQAEFIRSATAPKDFPRDGLPQVAFAGRSNVGKSWGAKTLPGWGRPRARPSISTTF